MVKKEKKKEHEVTENFIEDEINEIVKELKLTCNLIEEEEAPYNKKQLYRKHLFEGRCENVKGVLCEDVCESQEIVEAKYIEKIKPKSNSKIDATLRRIQTVHTKMCQKVDETKKYDKGKLHDTLCDLHITGPERDKKNNIIVNMLCEKECKTGNGEAKECSEERDEIEGGKTCESETCS